MRAGQAARVSYLGVNELADTAWQIGHQQAVGDRDSTITLATVALGGHYARVRTEARIAGPGGSTRQVALYFAGGEQMHDFRTIQDHDAPHTTSDLLFKGAVQDQSRSVYTGLIKIRKHARGTAAFQTNRNLTLSEGAWAESVPNLEIETNDVKCSHASTVGPIDAEQRFYLESRGIPTQIAERLIVLGFFDEVLDQLPVGPLAERAAPAGCRPSSTSSARSPGWPDWRPRRHRRPSRSTTSSRARRAASSSAASPSPSCASTTTSTPSATSAATPTSRCPRARCGATSGRSSARSTAARSAS